MDIAVSTIAPRGPRRDGVRGVFGAVVALLAVLLPTASTAQPRPNVLLIVSDDHDWHDYSFMGGERGVATPNIDALAAEGVLIARSYVPTSVCRPSLATLLTGLHAATTGITGNEPAATGVAALDETTGLTQSIVRRAVAVQSTLPRILGAHGYRSLQTGKWWEGDYRRAGFDEGVTTDRSRILGRSRDRSIGRGGIEPVTRFVEQAVADDVPFLVWYAPMLPHVPHAPPKAWRERYEPLVASGALSRNEALYLASVAWFDDTVGALRTLLRTKPGRDGRPLEESTIVVYAVDNGWLPDAGGMPTGLGAPRAKRSPYEAGVRGPLVLLWKGEVFDARPVAQKLGDTRLASTTDVLPTLLALLGLEHEQPPLAQGIDLLGTMRNEVFGDTYGPHMSIATSDAFVYGHPERDRTSRWMIEGRFKLVLPDADHYGGAPQLFDLLADPDEERDLSGAHPERVERMRARIEQWWAATRPVVRVAHEFRADAPLDGQAPDVASAASGGRWRAVGPAAGDGSIGPNGRAWLPFAPTADTRYELRGAGTGVALGFAAGAGSPVRFREGAPGWAALAGDAPAATSIVLDTHDADAVEPGAQWTVEVRVGGRLGSTRTWNVDERPIRFVALERAAGAAAEREARIGFVQLVETPRFGSLGWRRGDANGDGIVDSDDLAIVRDEWTGAQTEPPTWRKTLEQGDLDGDGAVGWSDLWTFATAIVSDVW